MHDTEDLDNLFSLLVESLDPHAATVDPRPSEPDGDNVVRVYRSHKYSEVPNVYKGGVSRMSFMSGGQGYD